MFQPQYLEPRLHLPMQKFSFSGRCSLKQDREDNPSRKRDTTVLWQEGFLRLHYTRPFLLLSTHMLVLSLFNIVAKEVKIAFKDKISTLVSLIAFLCAQATLILPLQHKNSALVCKCFMHLFNDLVNQIEEGWEGLVGVLVQVIFNTLWSEENVYAAGIRRRLLCIREAEQSARYSTAVPFNPLSAMAIGT